MEDIKNTLFKLLETKMTRSEMINTLDEINGRLDSAEEKINELEDITIRISKMKHRMEK